MKDYEYIIVQAGGEGTRLEQLTKNKPKAIVSIDNLPMLFYLFKKYPKSNFIIIADYKKDVLDAYLETFATVQYITVGTDGNKGTCSGIRNALACVPDKNRFMLVWSDLVLDNNLAFTLSCNEPTNIIGLSDTFSCRWKYFRKKFSEEKSDKCGVAGLFIFYDKNVLQNVPLSGEFVRWLQLQNIDFCPVYLGNTKEYGTLDNFKKHAGRCRPFNKITVSKNLLKKEGINDQGKNLAVREKAWYKHIERYEDVAIPKIHQYDPLIMDKIDGKNVFEYNLSIDEKKDILKNIVDNLNVLHEHEKSFPDRLSIMNAYYGKTMERLDKVRNLIPHNNDEYITINGKKCHNVYFFRDELKKKMETIECNNFNLIHGDCTFSNIILDDKKQLYFIDPRGYFGYTELHGDPMYDWAKLYYSVVGNYDQFNIGKFKLNIDDEVELTINSNGWDSLEKYFFNLLPDNFDVETLKLIHAVIWLSLTTYAWDDYDSVTGAFYNGIYYLEEVF